LEIFFFFANFFTNFYFVNYFLKAIFETQFGEKKISAKKIHKNLSKFKNYKKIFS